MGRTGCRASLARGGAWGGVLGVLTRGGAGGRWRVKGPSGRAARTRSSPGAQVRPRRSPRGRGRVQRRFTARSRRRTSTGTGGVDGHGVPCHGPSLASAVRLRTGALAGGRRWAGAGRGAWPEGSLNAIHAGRGVLHATFKPSNVLLAEDRPAGHRFGISGPLESTMLNQAGLVVGSPGFMSPEQGQRGYESARRATSSPWGRCFFAFEAGRRGGNSRYRDYGRPAVTAVVHGAPKPWTWCRPHGPSPDRALAGPKEPEGSAPPRPAAAGHRWRMPARAGKHGCPTRLNPPTSPRAPPSIPGSPGRGTGA